MVDIKKSPAALLSFEIVNMASFYHNSLLSNVDAALQGCCNYNKRKIHEYNRHTSFKGLNGQAARQQ